TLVAHLEAFKAYWSRTPTLDSQLSVPAIGLCAMAVQRGLELQVESGYIPDWLVHGVSPG
ncbi:MAG: immunity 49 family protein, partial [Myxococcales bacterium]|nr:immunity 49 family protein [Myxococcales bacterium]